MYKEGLQTIYLFLTLPTRFHIGSLPRQCWTAVIQFQVNNFTKHLISFWNFELSWYIMTHGFFQPLLAQLTMVERSKIVVWGKSLLGLGSVQVLSKEPKLASHQYQDKIYIQNMYQEPSVTQRTNLEMVDRGVFDWDPDIPETWNLKHGIIRT